MSFLPEMSRACPSNGQWARQNQDKSHWGHRRRPSRKEMKRSRGLHPVSVIFGRPDVEGFISETILGTAVIPEWADEGLLPPTKEESPPTRLGKVSFEQDMVRVAKGTILNSEVRVCGRRLRFQSPIFNSHAFLEVRTERKTTANTGNNVQPNLFFAGTRRCFARRLARMLTFENKIIHRALRMKMSRVQT